MKKLLLLAAFTCTASAQSWPEKPITFIVPFPPGGATDTVSRQIAAQVAPRLGQPIVVENRSGAGGTIGTNAIAKAAPDGYTIGLATTSAVAIAPSVYKDLPYESPKAFAPVIEIARGPYILSVRSSLPVQNMKEFIAHVRANPGKLNFGSPGKGTTHHLSTEMLSQVAGLNMVHVPYKGGTPAWAALVAGEIDVLFDTMPQPIPIWKGGKARALGVSGTRRLAALPDVATFAEQGIQGLEPHFFFGVLAPSGTPAPVVARLHAAYGEALRSPELREVFARLAIDPSPGTSQEFAARLASEVTHWGEVVRKAGIKPE